MSRAGVGALLCAGLVSCGEGPQTARVVVTSEAGIVLDVAATVAATAAERQLRTDLEAMRFESAASSVAASSAAVSSVADGEDVSS